MVKNQETGKSEKVHKLAQIKFSIIGDPLLKYEETRTSQLKLQQDSLSQRQNKFVDYLLELDFTNIKSVWINKGQTQYHEPPKSEKQYNEGFSFY
jgi:hypothetical protein